MEEVRFVIDPAVALWSQGAYLLEVGSYENALKTIGDYIKGYPDQARGYAQRSFCLTRLRRHPEALEAADRAIEVEPDQACGHHARALALCEMGQSQAALSPAEKAFELAGDARSRGTLVLVLLDCNQLARAEQLIAEGLESDPQDFSCRLGRALAHYRRGNLKEARSALTELLAEFPENPVLLYWLASFSLERREAASNLYLGSLAKRPEFDPARQGLLWCGRIAHPWVPTPIRFRIHQGTYWLAIIGFLLAVTISPRGWGCLAWLGLGLVWLARPLSNFLLSLGKHRRYMTAAEIADGRATISILLAAGLVYWLDPPSGLLLALSSLAVEQLYDQHFRATHLRVIPIVAGSALALYFSSPLVWLGGYLLSWTLARKARPQ